jgi:hypothetical protein
MQQKTINAVGHLPDTLQMHRTYLHDVTNLFAFEYPISPSSRHAGNVEQLGTIDHVVICESRQ